MFPLNTIIAWSINIIMNKKYDNNNIIIASRAYFLQYAHGCALLVVIRVYDAKKILVDALGTLRTTGTRSL
jgi:hypothetical protein